MRNIAVMIFFAVAFSANVPCAGQQADSLAWLYRACDSLGMETPVLNLNPGPEYQPENQDYGMQIGIEMTPGGRIWNCRVGGGDNADAFMCLNWSDDGGMTWSPTKLVFDPHDGALPLKRRSIVANLWTDPLGRLWFFFDQAMTYYDGRSGNWCAVCENPDDDNPVWSVPAYIGPGCSLQKPQVAETGEWILPQNLWTRKKMDILLEDGWTENPLHDAYHDLDSERKAFAYVSENQGVSWEKRGGVVFPGQTFDEHIIMPLKDGRWWMTARTELGIQQSFSSDRGYTWTEPELYQPHVNSRHCLIRLNNGHLLLIRHGNIDKKLKGRSHLRAFVSKDEGKTWQGGLLLDERSGISYPDGFQNKDGNIYISYDYDRSNHGELYMARFREGDVRAGELMARNSFLKRLIHRPGKSAASVGRTDD